MDVRSIIVAGVTLSGTEGEDPAEYFDSHDAGALLDPLVDDAETATSRRSLLGRGTWWHCKKRTPA